MICAVCGKGAQRNVAGFSLCPQHAESLSSSIVMDVYEPLDWFRQHRSEHLKSQGVHLIS